MHKAGFVNLLGNPNVGKSTLMNALVGERLSIITAKAQTTRHRIKGIVNGDDYQIIYSDLPGILAPAYKMQEAMMGFVNEALEDADLILYLVEPDERRYDTNVVEKIRASSVPTLLLINKIDTSTPEKVQESEAFWQTVFPNSRILPISAREHIHIDVLQAAMLEYLPESPPYFPKDDLTDKPMRFFMSEIIREKILLNYKKEIPYSVEVVVENFKEEDNIIRIAAMIYVERESQKAILIGHQGTAVKTVGIQAREDMEAFLEKKVFLELRVKVLKDWRNHELSVKRFGYKL